MCRKAGKVCQVLITHLNDILQQQTVLYIICATMA